MKKAFVLAIMSIMALELVAQLNPLLERAKSQYAFSSWEGRTARSYPQLLKEWNIPLLMFSTNEVEAANWSPSTHENSCGNGRIPQEEIATIINTNGHTLVRISSTVAASQKMAHEDIIERLAMTTCPLPYTMSTKGIGDHSFCLSIPDSGMGAWIFSRNNVVVAIYTYSSSFSAESIARQIDSDILKRSLELPSSGEVK